MKRLLLGMVCVIPFYVQAAGLPLYDDAAYQTEAEKLKPEIAAQIKKVEPEKVMIPRVEALPKPIADPGKIAEQYYSKKKPVTPKLEHVPYVFISLSMPKPSLERIFRQASTSGAILVLRGVVKGSFAETVKAVKDIQEKYPSNIQIDPESFKRYSITSVPATVFLADNVNTKSCGVNYCSADSFLVVFGDVSLDYALEKMIAYKPSYEKNIRPFLQKLKG